VTVWYTAPTAIRMLMRSVGAEAPRVRPLGAALRRQRRRAAQSRGGRLWGEEAFGLPFHDNWWQTETGGIMIANFAARRSSRARWACRCRASRRRSCAVTTTRSGSSSTGRRRGDDPWWRASWRCEGLALDDARLPPRWRSATPSASPAAGISPATSPSATPTATSGSSGRADDVIKSAGHLIGPFEVESALMEHPAVAEAAVIGKPDDGRRRGGQGLRRAQARLRLDPEALRKELIGHARKRSAPRWRPRRSTSAPTCPRPAPARSCAGSSRRASWACRKATSRRWKATRNERKVHLDPRPRPAARRCCASAASRRSAPSSIRPEDPRLPAPLRRRGGGGGRA
jgi:acetyl-CoA synthetase